jgi:hypothetical protein
VWRHVLHMPQQRQSILVRQKEVGYHHMKWVVGQERLRFCSFCAPGWVPLREEDNVSIYQTHC